MVEFLEYMLPARGDRYKVELMICYAARTSAYRDPQQDAVPREQLKTSLAYKIFEGLGQGKTFTVTARTGATGFDETQGVITVEQDEHAELEYLRRHVLETPEYKAGDLWFKAQDLPTRTTLATKYNKRTIREVDAVPANTDAERRAKAYFRCQSEYREIRGRANDIRDLNRYGTIRYSTERQGIKIKNVFTGATLYEGPWL
jgi:hypothetical protein